MALSIHGHSSRRDGPSPTYRSWVAMMGRCYNPARKKYDRYRGRGITVHLPWHRFEAFLSDMGQRPEGTTIERIDNDGNYGPSNCRWATREDQANNKSNTVLIEYQGRKLTVKQWAQELNVTASALRYRVENWDDIDRVFSEPYEGAVVNVTCGGCGLTFTCSASKVRRGRGKYCSRPCANGVNNRTDDRLVAVRLPRNGNAKRDALEATG